MEKRLLGRSRLEVAAVGRDHIRGEVASGGTHPSAKSPSDWFTGTVRIDPLFTVPAVVMALTQRA